jgi:hypothetical protein
MPDGFLEKHTCAGDYIKHCKENRKELPVILHGVPLSFDDMVRLGDDPVATLYPGNQLPASLLKKIKNTRFDKKWSQWLWANIFTEIVMKFMDNHKGKIIKNRKEFLILAVHPSNPAYHLFGQDYFINEHGSATIPFRRETCLKTAWKATFDGIFCYKPKPGGDGGWDVTVVHDPNELFIL